jgi:Bardet-Biedl syndrome 2 protein
VLGRFDGSTASVAYATAAGKVFVHSPQDHSSGAAGQQQCLNINKQVTALAAGALLPNSVRDVLLIGTPTCLHCYDAERNCDLFFRDAPEGVQALAVGAHGPQRTPVVYVGGAGTLQAWDASGRELFWTAVGGAVTALALADVDGDGCLELLAGCDDGSICMFRDSQQLQHITEADGVVALAGLGPGRKWAYALANGTIGVYAAGVRLWRVKSNHVANSLVAYELGAGSTAAEAGTAATGSSAAGAGKVRCSTSGDGAAGALQLVSGWSNGRVEARCASSGEVVGRDSLGASIAVLLVGQLRDAGGAELELLAVSTEGELRGYLPHHDELVADVGGDVSLQQRLLVELAQKKQQLVYELASYQQATGGGSMTSGAAADGSGSGSSGGGGVAGSLTALAGGLLGSRGGTASSGGGASSHPSGTGGGAVTAGHIASIIPPDTCVDSAITVNKTTQTCELLMKTNNDTVIRAALIFGEQVGSCRLQALCLHMP